MISIWLPRPQMWVELLRKVLMWYALKPLFLIKLQFQDCCRKHSVLYTGCKVKFANLHSAIANRAACVPFCMTIFHFLVHNKSQPNCMHLCSSCQFLSDWMSLHLQKKRVFYFQSNELYLAKHLQFWHSILKMMQIKSLQITPPPNIPNKWKPKVLKMDRLEAIKNLKAICCEGWQIQKPCLTQCFIASSRYEWQLREI